MSTRCFARPIFGASSSLFAASSLGWQAKGIEVLPVGIYASKARFVVQDVDIQKLRNAIYEMKQVNFLITTPQHMNSGILSLRMELFLLLNSSN